MADAKLPCDVKLPPATTIKAGCDLSTLIAALVVRGMDSTPQSHEALIAELRATIEALGGGCDANSGGLHSAMSQGKYWFCPGCGMSLKRVAYVLPHVKPGDVREALSRPTVARVPEGFVLVPKSPTAAMLVAGCALKSPNGRVSVASAYRAMLAASQSKETPQIAQPDYDKLGLGDPEGRN